MQELSQYGSISNRSRNSTFKNGSTSYAEKTYSSEIDDFMDGMSEVTSLFEEDYEPRSKSGADGPTHWLLGVFMLLNSIVGAGILTLPFGVLHSGGLIPGLISQTVMVIISFISAVILAWLKDKSSGVRSYQDLSGYYLDRIGQTIASVVLILLCYVACIAYTTAVRDQLSLLLTSNLDSVDLTVWYLSDAKFITVLIILGLVTPLCFLPKLDHLKVVCTIASSCVVFVAVMVVAGYFDQDLITDKAIKLKAPDIEPLLYDTDTSIYISILYGFSTFLAAYTFQPEAVLVYDNISPKTFTYSILTTTVALVASTVFYNVIVIFSILTFGSAVNSQILLNYNSGNIFVIIGTVAYMLELLLIYPLIHFTAREGLLTLLKQRLFIPTGSTLETKVKIGLAIIYIVTSLTFALLTPEMFVVIQLSGALNGIIVLIIPGLCLLKYLENNKHENLLTNTVLWGLAIFLIIFGSFIVTYVFVQSIIAIVSP